MDKLLFISESVIGRLKDGTFVPQRRSNPGSLKMQERRDTISPLAVTKRCVRYDHHVFTNRKDLVIEMAESLNHPQKKLVLLAGPQGCGKTSLARGVIEIMGGGPEQLLWFDVSAHTDFDEIILFLIQYITYICSALSIDSSEKEESAPLPQAEPGTPEDPFTKLEALILKVSHIPLLIILDNVEHIVNREYQIHSFPLKETLNFLLSFPNIKMILCGERLPYADMSTNSAVLTDIKLSGLTEQDISGLLAEQSTDGEGAKAHSALLVDLYRKTRGYPWLLKVLFYLNKQQGGGMSFSLQEFNTALDIQPEAPVEAIARFIYNHLTPQEKDVAQVLAFLRHPADFDTVVAISRYCKPDLAANSPENYKDTLDHSILKPLMKRTFPPQAVLEHIRNRHESAASFQPWYELYRQIKKIFYNGIAPAERARIHRLLQDFYLKEKNKPADQRVYTVKSKALIAEARFHGNASRERRSVFAAGGGVETQSYLYGGIKPLSRENKYERIPAQRLSPESRQEEFSENISHETLIAPVFEEPVTIQTSLQSDLAPGGGLVSLDDLALTEEEKALLLGGAGAFEKVPQTFEDYLARVSLEEGLPAPEKPEAPKTEKPVASVPQEPEEDRTGELVAHDLKIEETDPVEQQLQQKLIAAVAGRNRPAMVHHLIALARHRSSKGLYGKAEECLKKALEAMERPKPADLAEIYSQLGSIHKETYRHNSALDYLGRALHHYENVDTHEEWQINQQGRLYQDLGDIYAFRGQHHDAITAFYKALDYFSKTTNEARLAEVYFKLAQVYDVMGVSENAVTYYEQSYTLDSAKGNDLSCAATLANIGSIHLEAGRLGEALDYFQRSLRYDRRQENAEGEYKTLDLMAQVHIRLKDWPKAVECYHKAMAVALKEDNNTWKANAYLKLGNLARLQGHWPKTLEYYQAARDSATLSDLSEESQQLLETRIEEATRVIRENPVS